MKFLILLGIFSPYIMLILFQVFFGQYMAQDSFVQNNKIFEKTLKFQKIVFYTFFLLSSISVLISRVYREKIKSAILYYFFVVLVVLLNYFMLIVFSAFLMVMFGNRIQQIQTIQSYNGQFFQCKEFLPIHNALQTKSFSLTMPPQE